MTPRLGLLTDSVAHLSIEEALDLAVDCGLESIELATGAWSTAPHLDLASLLRSPEARRDLRSQFDRRGLVLTALNCSGNPLHPGVVGSTHDLVTRQTLELAGLLGVPNVVMMSGLPGGPGDVNPNWITVSWPPETTEILEWQWTERVLPYWSELTAKAQSMCDARICLEMHAQQAVYSPTSFMRLRDQLHSPVFANLDPSHLLWMGSDPLAAVRALRASIGHVHAKDAKIEPAAALTGRQETLPPDRVNDRSWNYTTLGYGQPAEFWRTLFLELSRIGYDGAINIEHEDYSMGRVEGVRKASDFLRAVAVSSSPDYRVQNISSSDC